MGRSSLSAANAGAVAEFFPISPATAREIMGPDNAEIELDTDEATQGWVARFDALFDRIRQITATDGSS